MEIWVASDLLLVPKNAAVDTLVYMLFHTRAIYCSMNNPGVERMGQVVVAVAN